MVHCESLSCYIVISRAQYIYLEKLELEKPPIQASPQDPASNAIDGILSTCSLTAQVTNPWFDVHSDHSFFVNSVAITSHMSHTLDNVAVRVGGRKPTENARNPLCYTVSHVQAGKTVSYPCASRLNGKYVDVRLDGSRVLSVCEIVVYGERLSGEWRS